MNILTAEEAASVLRYESKADMPSHVETLLIPAIDEFVKSATGRDWGRENPVDPTAKLVASMLLVQWYENPSMVGNSNDLHFGIINLMTQLSAKVLGGSEG